jgi:hypothetical protein
MVGGVDTMHCCATYARTWTSMRSIVIYQCGWCGAVKLGRFTLRGLPLLRLYLRRWRIEVMVSHGICPTCAAAVLEEATRRRSA